MIFQSARSPDILEPIIEAIWDRAVQEAGAFRFTVAEREAVEETVGLLNRGHLRVAEDDGAEWKVNIWLKHSILLFFKAQQVEPMTAEKFSWVDKIPVKSWTCDMGVRVVPPAMVRYGSYVASGCILMPSFVNIGAYVDQNSMVDTWATVGSCAQIGKNVHLSGGVGIGGVLEPAQALPVIIEDDCFIGSRAIVVEGVHIKRGAVLGAGVVLTASTQVVDVTGAKPVFSKGFIPENSVVIPGTRTKTFKAGDFQVPCALIIGERSAQTDTKTSLNQVLREYDISV